MKILRIIYDWPKPWSGLAPHPYEITYVQAKMGHEIDVFAGYWPKSGPEQIEGVKLTTFMREPFPGSIFFTTSVSLFFKYLSWRKKNTPDIIHCHGHFAIWIFLYRLILKKHFPWSNELKVPIVVHFHKTAKGRWEKLLEQKQDIKGYSKNLQWPLEVYAERISAEVAAACIFVSDETLNEAVKYYSVDKQKCFVIESGVNTDLFKPIGSEEKEKSKSEIGLDTYDKVVLNHGMMVERKNVHVLIEALKHLPPNYKLLLVGPGDPKYEDKMNEIIKNNNLEDRIKKVGYTPYPEVPIAYQVSDVFVLPSMWEGLPKVVMQGLACGIPCLVSGFTLSERIDGLYYLENLEPEYIANQIIPIVENKAPVDVAKTIRLYSWEQRAKEIEKVYEFAKNNYL